ncbi:MAG: TolB family protein, partial [Frankiaceae bacterium]
MITPAGAAPGGGGQRLWEQWAGASGYWSPAPGPHGRSVAMVSDRGGLPQVWLQPLDDLWAPRVPRLLPTGNDHIQSVSWSADGKWIACLGAPGGNATRTRVWVVRPDGTGLRRVAGVRQGCAVMGPWTHTGSTLTITTTGRRPEENNSHLLRVGAWESFRLSYGFPFTVLALSHDGERALLRRGARGARQLVLVDLRTHYEKVLLPSELRQTGTTEAAAFAPNGDMYALTDAGRERVGLVRIRPRGRKFDVETVAQRDGEDLDSFVLSEDGSAAALVWNVAGRSRLELLDTATSLVNVPAPVPADVVDSCIFTRDGRHLLICAQ